MVGVSTALTGAVGGLASLIAIRLALGFGEGAAFPTATRAMAIWTPASSWGFAQGIVHAAARIGNALTPPLVTALLAFGSWRGVFVILGVATSSGRHCGCGFSGMIRATIRRFPLTTWPLCRSRPVRGAARTMPWLKLARRMLPVTIVDFCYGWTLWLFLSWIPSFFFENYQLNLQSSALFSTEGFWQE